MFELMSVNHSARSGGIIGGYLFDFLYHEGILYVLIRIGAILMSTHNIPFSLLKRKSP